MPARAPDPTGKGTGYMEPDKRVPRQLPVALQRIEQERAVDEVKAELAQVEECTETILGAVGNLAKINENDPEEMLSILRRVCGSLEVVTIFLLREEADARGGQP